MHFSYENVIFKFVVIAKCNLSQARISFPRALKIGDREIEYNDTFQLILHTKLANPHYKPELQAQCTLINFTVTRDGLEDQLLAEVVKAERPDLEELKVILGGF